jgi:hypothetical protein
MDAVVDLLPHRKAGFYFFFKATRQDGQYSQPGFIG